MGFNSSIMIMNDGLDQIEKNPEQFAEQVKKLICEGDPGQQVGVGNHANCLELISCHHADMTSVSAVGGNCSNILGYSMFGHSTDAAKVEVLKDVARKLGYELVEKDY